MITEVNRGELMERLLGRGIDNPERLTAELSNGAIEGSIRWFDQQQQLGKKVGSGLLAAKLKGGGLTGFGVQVKPEPAWWRTWKGREAWIEANVPDLDYDYAETAVISLLQDKQDPTPESVRTRAQELQRDQQAHDEDCRRSVEAQRKRSLSGREASQHSISSQGSEAGATKAGKAADESQPVSRPESEQKAAAA